MGTGSLILADVFSLGFRAGFWQRSLGLTIDALVIGIPFQILVVCLYAATGGAVQGTSTAFDCHYVEMHRYLLDPPPPTKLIFARECRSSFFGFETSRSLIVGTVSEENVTEISSQTYDLGLDGQPRKALHLGWLARFALLAYLITMEHRTGVTLGNYIFRMEVVSWKSPGSPGIPLKNAFIRQVTQWIGLIPIVVFGSGHVIPNELHLFMVALAVSVLWYPCNFLLIIAKRDPFYDKLARVAVLRE
jgi:hypothetical protein